MESATDNVKVTILGAGGCGKTAVTLRLVKGEFQETYDPTIEATYSQKFDVDGRPVLIDILDTAGQDDFVTMMNTWIKSGQGFVLMYSVVDRQSFADVDKFHDAVVKNKGDNSPMVLCGNKADLEDERVITASEGKELAEKYGCNYVECSAKSGEHLEDVFFSVVRLVRKRNEASDAESGALKASPKGKKDKKSASSSKKPEKEKKKGGGCVLF